MGTREVSASDSEGRYRLAREDDEEKGNDGWNMKHRRQHVRGDSERQARARPRATKDKRQITITIEGTMQIGEAEIPPNPLEATTAAALLLLPASERRPRDALAGGNSLK